MRHKDKRYDVNNQIVINKYYKLFNHVDSVTK
jgi:hypothetical protein